jgi:hypothetical protein
MKTRRSLNGTNRRERGSLERWDRRQQKADERRMDPPASAAELREKTCGDPACRQCGNGGRGEHTTGDSVAGFQLARATVAGGAELKGVNGGEGGKDQ